MAHPNVNYELLVDGNEINFFNNVSVDHAQSALSGFGISLSNPENIKSKWFRGNSEIEFKASYGDQPLKTQISGFIKARKFNVGVRRTIQIAGIDKGDYMLRRKPWDEGKNPIEYNNEKASAILADLAGFAPELTLKITRIPREARLDWITDPKANYILDEFKAVAEYAGYGWRINDADILASGMQELTAANAKHNMVVGNREDFGTDLPELPYVSLLSGSLDEDFGSIRNSYQVQGAEGINASDENQISIAEFGKYEGYYEDPRLTSRQSCQVVAKQLAEINGIPRITASVTHRGVDSIIPGDVVRVSDIRGTFNVMRNPNVRVVGMTNTYGLAWKTTTQLGTLPRTMIDVL